MENLATLITKGQDVILWNAQIQMIAPTIDNAIRRYINVLIPAVKLAAEKEPVKFTTMPHPAFVPQDSSSVTINAWTCKFCMLNSDKLSELPNYINYCCRDECAANPCHPSAVCKNTIGSFSCSCPLGRFILQAFSSFIYIFIHFFTEHILPI